MQIAIDKDGKRILAFNAKKNDEYLCPICRGEVILRQGNINITHFAHRSNECTDNWYYDMSEWHYSMQKRFPENQREVVVNYMRQTHRADVLHGNQIIEFQHSPISTEELVERNNFYNEAGYSVAWVFDVQDQYDFNAITIMDHDKALMYKWSNPKRCLQCFPQPKEYNKKFVIYLYWIDEDDYECFNRVIWSTSDDNGNPDFKRFIVSEDGMVSDDTESPLSVGDFFETKDDQIRNLLSKLNCRYKIKYSGVKGHPRDDYVCPRTNIFGIKLSGETACSYCRYCAATKRKRKGFISFCCYPNQVNEVTKVHPGYECSNIPSF
jgi:hypothetical protein